MQKHLLFCEEGKHLGSFLFHRNVICCEMNEFRSLNFPPRLSLSTSQMICSNQRVGVIEISFIYSHLPPTLLQNHILSR